MSEATGGERDAGGSRTEFWQRTAAFLCLGMAVGAPAGQSLAAIRFLPGANIVGSVLTLPIVLIGTVALARIVLSPFLDAFDPPGLSRMGRRRGWTALLTALLIVLAIPILVMAPAGNPAGATASPAALILMLVAFVIAGGLMACIDGLRTAQPGHNAQGVYAAAQYLGTIIPGGIGALILRGADSWTISVFSCAFLAAAWLGLWLLPGREAPALRVLDRPEAKRFLAADRNLSRSGMAVTAWLAGVFVSPIADFFRRHGAVAWTILAVLILGDFATNLEARQQIRLHATLLGESQARTIGTVHAVALYVGVILGALIVWRWQAVRGLAAAFVLAGAATVAGMAAIAAAPSLPWFLVALAFDAVADGAVLMCFVAFIARAVTPTYAAFQFSLLWLAAIPTTLINRLRTSIETDIGPIGLYVLFLVLLAAAIALTLWLARRLDADDATQS